MAAVSLKSVGKEYRHPRGKRFQAVQNLDLEVADGELLVLAGPSGSGKSSILRMIAGLESISTGEISIGDRVVNQLPARDRDVAMVFQKSALYPHLTVCENLAFGLRMRKVSSGHIEERVREAAEMLEMRDLLKRYPESLSGGERQRVALGRAIVRRPKVFLFDEPLSSLDAPARVQMRTEILRIHQRMQIATIYVTHDQAEALTLADQLIVMRGGRVQQSGKPLDAYRQPENSFVAGFLGNPAMSFLRGALSVQGDHVVFQEVNPGIVRSRLTITSRAFAGVEVILGVRPEDVQIHLYSDVNAFPGTVKAIEALGAETIIHLDTGAHRLTCRRPVSPFEFTVDMSIFFQFDVSKAHLFDATSGLRIN